MQNDIHHYKERIQQLIAEEKEATASANSQERYSQNHQKRFDYILELCQKHQPSHSAKVLDVGRSELTYLLSRKYKEVTSLGFPLEADDGGHREVSDISDLPHIVFDLNKADETDKWPTQYAGKFDLIIFSETIEHVHIAPEMCLLLFRYLLKENGKILVTTPNAASIYKRVRLLFGVHPYEKIRYYKLNPGHFREYTLDEMKGIGAKVGLQTVDARLVNYDSINLFESLSAFKYICLKPFELVPAFRDYQVVVFSPAN